MTTVITKPTWTVDGWAGNTVDENGVEWIVHTDKGWYNPVGVRGTSSPRSDADGDYVERNRRAPRVISLEGYAHAPTVDTADAAMDRFNGLLGDGELHDLVVAENARDLIAPVLLADGTESVRFNQLGFDFQLILIAPDPRKLDVVTRSVLVGLASAAVGGVMWNGPAGSTGVEWNGTAGTTGVEWGASGTSNYAVLDNTAGTAEADILFTISGPVTMPSIVDASGRTMTYQGSLLTGETLTIDTGTGAVRFQGVDRGPQLRPAQLFSIPARSTLQIGFTAAAGTGLLTAQWHISYR